MKQYFKSLVVLLIGLVLSVNVWSQATPALELRISNASTAFGVNVPIGAKIYNVADGKYWVATAAVTSTQNLTTAASSFTQLNPAEVDGSVSNEGSLTVTDKTTWSKNIHSNTAGGVDVVIKVDSVSNGLSISRTANKIILANTSLNTDAQTLTYTPTTRTMAISGGNSQTIPLAGGGETNAGLISKADYDRFYALSQTTYKVESFAEAAAGATGQVNTLTNAPKAATAVTVSLNGVELKSTQYTVATNTVQVTIPVYQYDNVSIAYTY